MEDVFVGIDIGTTSIKISAVDTNLKSIYEKQYSYKYLIPQNGWCEIDPDTWFNIVLKGLKTIFHNVSIDRIAGIGITGQMHTTVFVDKHGFSIRPAIMWNDIRTKEMIQDIKKRLCLCEKSKHIADIVSTGSPLANLLWVKTNESKYYNKINKLLITKDYLVFKLTGIYSTDFCDASTSSLFDLNSNQWSKEVQKEFSFDKSIFPNINSSSKIVGFLSEEIQRSLEINKKIPVVAGTGDNVASTIASGGFDNGQPLISLGTSGVIVIPNNKRQLKQTGKNVVARIKDNDNSIITQGTVQAGAKINSWWMTNILGTQEFNEEQNAIDERYLGENEVLFFPHLNGEKTIYGKPELRGVFAGLSLETTRSEMTLSVLEGLAFGIRQLYELMKNNDSPHYFTVVGGGAKSDLWLKIFANVLGFPMKRVDNAQEAVHGAAILAIIGVNGKYHFTENNFRVFEPSIKINQNYNKKYQKYLELSKCILEYSDQNK